MLLAALVPAGCSPGGAATKPAGRVETPASPILTSSWRDEPADPARVRIDPIAGVTEPSDLLFVDGALYTVSDSFRQIYRIDLNAPAGAPLPVTSWTPEGLPEGTDLEAMARLPGGEVLLANETTGVLFVLSPFPAKACAAWQTGIGGACLVGRPNCGIEALAVLPDGRLFVGREREPRSAYLFDLPRKPCAAARLEGRTYLLLPDGVGPDISAATFDAVSGRLLLVARSRQAVLEFEVPSRTPGDTSPRPLALLGSFRYATTEATLGYLGFDFPKVEGIAIGPDRVLYLAVDNNERISRLFGDRSPALLRFFPVEDASAP